MGKDGDDRGLESHSDGFRHQDIISFVDFPEDVQLCILSFLSSQEISAFASTSKHFNCLCLNDNKLWFSICVRKWGRKTLIKKWGHSKITFKCLYQILVQWENLIGFWRRSGLDSPLVFFEWGPFFITGSRISPCRPHSYEITKTPFVWMGLSGMGLPVSYILPDHRFDFVKFLNELNLMDMDIIPVTINFVGRDHFVMEGSTQADAGRNLYARSEEDSKASGAACGENLLPGSPPDRLMSEIYSYFANRTSADDDRVSRGQRKKDKGRNGWRRFEPEHYVKIVNYLPTSSRPLQGLWKGIDEVGQLNFYLVSYDDIGGLACRKIGNSSGPLSGHSPVFWTSDTTFIEAPFSEEERAIYDGRIHIQGHSSIHDSKDHYLQENGTISSILCINSSYELVIRDLSSSMAEPRQVEGRIWQYEDRTFGFGFLRDNYIIDLKHVALEENLLDPEQCLVNAV